MTAIIWIDYVFLVACLNVCLKRSLFSLVEIRLISQPALDGTLATARNPTVIILTGLLKVSFVQGPACLGGVFIYGIWLSAFHVGHYLVTSSQEGGRQLVLCSTAILQVEKSQKEWIRLLKCCLPCCSVRGNFFLSCWRRGKRAWRSKM